MIAKVFDHHFGLQESVARHGERAPSVNVHPCRQFGPGGETLCPYCHLKETFEQTAVLDARPQALVVLRVPDNQPGTVALGLRLGSHNHEVGFHICCRNAFKSDNGHGEVVDDGGCPVRHRSGVSITEQLGRASELSLGVGDYDFHRTV